MGPKKRRYRRCHGPDGRFVPSSGHATHTKSSGVIKTAKLSREEQLEVLRDYARLKREKKRAYADRHRKEMLERYHRRRGKPTAAVDPPLEIAAAADTTASGAIGGTSDVTLTVEDKPVETGDLVPTGGVSGGNQEAEGKQEADTDDTSDDIEEKPGADTDDTEEMEEAQEDPVITRVLASYTSIAKNKHVDNFRFPDRPSDWKFEDADCPRLELFMTNDSRGIGVRTLEDIPRNHFVIEYVGELISEYEKLCVPDGRYLIELVVNEDNPGASVYIYPDNFGNIAKFINHSCAPNCIAMLVNDGTARRIAIMTRKKIRAKEELTFKYSDSKEYFDTYFRCACNAKNCISKKM